MTPALPHYLIVSAALFSLGMLGVLTRRNAVNVLMGVELGLSGANITLVAFSGFGTGTLTGRLFAVFVIVTAAAEELAFQFARPETRESHQVDVRRVQDELD